MCHFIQVAAYLFCTGRNVIHIIISSIIFHVIWHQIFSISRFISSAACTFWLSISVFLVKIVAYKTSSWVFILHRKEFNALHYIKHHLPHQMIPDVSRYHVTSRQLFVPFWLSISFFCQKSCIFNSSLVFILQEEMVVDCWRKSIITFTDKFLPLKLQFFVLLHWLVSICNSALICT